MSPDPNSFDPFGDDYHQRLDRCLNSLGGRDSRYYNRLKANWLLRLAPKYLPNPAGADFLDLGCGPGLTVAGLASSFRLGVGLDSSRGMLQAATAAAQPNAAFVRADVARLPFLARSFDLVFTVTVLHHLEDRVLPTLMAEIKRVLKPGGLVVHFDHNPYNFGARQVVKSCEFDQDHAIMRSLSQVAAASAEAGLVFRESGYIAFFPAIIGFLEPLEPRLKRLPLGAQYFLAATAPA